MRSFFLGHAAPDIPDSERIAPFCAYFGRCGGCAVQDWQHAPYLAWKRGLVASVFKRAGIDAEIGPIIDAHGEGRRRAIFHARRGDGVQLAVGFSEAGSHTIVPIEQCPILAPSLGNALDAARAIASALAITGKPLDTHVTATDNGLDIDVRGSGPLDAGIRADLSALAATHNLARLTRHRELVIMRDDPAVTIGQAHVTLPAGSFLQPTHAGEDALAALAIAHAGKAKRIADLFSGFGPFALRLAQTARVDAFDSDGPAIAALGSAVRNTQGLKPITAQTRDLFRRPLMPPELKDYDAVVFDPPRLGAQAQVEQLAKSKVSRIIAVSCNAATFARDAAILIAGGYTISEVTPVDQFRHTPHVELVAAFAKR